MGDSEMKRRPTSVIVPIALACLLTALLASCGQKDLAEPVPAEFVNETLPFALSDPMPVPEAKDGSDRGEAIEFLVPMYGASYEDDKYLEEDVKLFRQWQWAELYASLDRKAQEEPLHLNTFRLQAEVYLTNSKYNEALAALDSVLRVHHDDIYALGLSAYIKHFMGNEDQSQQRLQALKNVSGTCYAGATRRPGTLSSLRTAWILTRSSSWAFPPLPRAVSPRRGSCGSRKRSRGRIIAPKPRSYSPAGPSTTTFPRPRR